jgi:hypothetical protein
MNLIVRLLLDGKEATNSNGGILRDLRGHLLQPDATATLLWPDCCPALPLKTEEELLSVEFFLTVDTVKHDIVSTSTEFICTRKNF